MEAAHRAGGNAEADVLLNELGVEAVLARTRADTMRGRRTPLVLDPIEIDHDDAVERREAGTARASRRCEGEACGM